MDKLFALEQLVGVLNQVPYISPKNFYRVAIHLLEMEDADLNNFCKTILQAKSVLELCSNCCAWKAKKKDCFLCSSKREYEIICVVETWHDMISIERTDGYLGSYHILGGSVCPIDGIGPEDLSIDLLIDRVRKNKTKEIILALSQTPEGEATAAYIAKKLQNKALKISRLARGLSVGAALEYTDRVTIYKAISDRQPF